MSDLIDRKELLTRMENAAPEVVFKPAIMISFDGVKNMILGCPKAFDTDKLKSKLKDLKHAVDHCENWDYANGFICALSNVEGIIAEMESEVEKE